MGKIKIEKEQTKKTASPKTKKHANQRVSNNIIIQHPSYPRTSSSQGLRPVCFLKAVLKCEMDE